MTFSGSDQTNTFRLESGQEVCAFLTWDDWPLTSTDLDLVLVRETGRVVIASSTNDQASGLLEPTEALCFTNAGPADFFGVEIAEYMAPGQERVDLYVSGVSSIQYAVASGSVPEPASSPAALAVGAVCWQTGELEPYSSRGPTVDGRTKPDLLAADSVSTVSYGAADGSAAGCGASGFTGTSAAAPHVAGAAALLLQQQPTVGPAGLEALLETASSAHANADMAQLWLAPPTGNATAAPVNTRPPSLYADPGRVGMLGDWLEVRPGSWVHTGQMQFEYQWGRCDSSGLNCTAIPGATESFYAPDVAYLADVRYGVTVTASNAAGSTAAALDTTYGAVGVVPARPYATSLPTIVGIPRTGQTLSVGDDPAWVGSPGTVTYQWIWCELDGGHCSPIEDSGGRSFTPNRFTAGHPVRVVAHAQGANWVRNVVSLPTAPIASSPPVNLSPPTISGQPFVSSTFTSTPGTWSGPDLTYAYQWHRCDPVESSCVPLSGANSLSYTATLGDLGKQLQLYVGATNSDGSFTVGSALTPVLTLRPPPIIGGGGGGGGGGAVPPNLHVGIGSASPVGAVGSGFALVVTVENRSIQSSDSSTVTIALSGLTLVSAAPDRGPGCTSAGSTVTCPLDFVPGLYSTRVVLGVTLTSPTASAVATAVSSPADSDPTDDSAIWSTAPAPTAAPTPFPPPSSPKVTAPAPQRSTASTRGKTITGNAQANKLNGTARNDVIKGGKGNDTIHGRAGNDVIVGGPGADRLYGDAGNDTIRARDHNHDTIDCGPGRDTVYADRGDTVARNCETVRRR